MANRNFFALSNVRVIGQDIYWEPKRGKIEKLIKEAANARVIGQMG